MTAGREFSRWRRSASGRGAKTCPNGTKWPWPAPRPLTLSSRDTSNAVRLREQAHNPIQSGNISARATRSGAGFSSPIDSRVAPRSAMPERLFRSAPGHHTEVRETNTGSRDLPDLLHRDRFVGAPRESILRCAGRNRIRDGPCILLNFFHFDSLDVMLSRSLEQDTTLRRSPTVAAAVWHRGRRTSRRARPKNPTSSSSRPLHREDDDGRSSLPRTSTRSCGWRTRFAGSGRRHSTNFSIVEVASRRPRAVQAPTRPASLDRIFAAMGKAPTIGRKLSGSIPDAAHEDFRGA